MIAAQAAVGADHPVTGDNDPNRVSGTSARDGSGRARTPNKVGKLPVGACRPGWDPAQSLPYQALESRAAQVERWRHRVGAGAFQGRAQGVEPVLGRGVALLQPGARESSRRIRPQGTTLGTETQIANTLISYSEQDVPEINLPVRNPDGLKMARVYGRLPA